MNSTNKNILVINIGIGNIQSVVNSINYLGYSCTVGNSVEHIRNAKIIILPGVGAFGEAVAQLNNLEIINILRHKLQEIDVYFLGICLGMQLLFDKSFEHGEHEGLGLIKGTVERMSFSSRIPHVGWNNINIKTSSMLFNHMTECKDFYFDHSYRAICNPKNVSSEVTYDGENIVSSVEKGNIFGVQFHPEKSQFLGIKLIENFLIKALN